MKSLSVQGRKRLREFEALCRQQGLPLTVQRRTILEQIVDRKDHPTAQQLFKEVQERLPGVSRTTVYRVLDTLVRFQLVQKIYQPGAAARYDPNTRQHHHFACLQCSTVIDLEDERFDAVALPDLRRRGFHITESHIYFRGTCSSCRAKVPSRSSTASRTVKRKGAKPKKHNATAPRPRRRRRP
jgi:Fur family peroxide stress response transcriptional regulator